MNAITVTGLGKAYKNYAGRWGRLREWLDPRHRKHHQLSWVLQDVSFEIGAGQAVGIIGVNGAGKSTLLKMITGTTHPTTGSVKINGHVAALLELGMGFHAEFTGRQNAYMAGQLLGLSVDEITELMPQIEAFAEIGDYMDQCVRTYSSGMQMRLAFSVATARRPDVLIVDEALSVGDSYFQHKSFERIREFKQQGTTLLFVSHDKQAILSICDRAILLHSGQLLLEGEPESVLDYYNAMLADWQKHNIATKTLDDGSTATASGSREAEFIEIHMTNEQNVRAASFMVGEPCTVRARIRVNSPIPNLVMGCGIKDKFGQMMFGTNTYHTEQMIDAPEPGALYDIEVSFAMNLGPGSYSLTVSLHADDSHISGNYDWRDREMVFDVVNYDKYFFAGSLWNPMVFSIKGGKDE